MSKPKVIVTRRWPEAVEAKLQELFDVELNVNDVPMSVEQMRDALARADAFCPTVCDSVNADVFNGGEIKAKIIGSYGVGFNHIDIDAARAKNLVVTNTPEVLTDCTADLAMTLIFMASRRAGEGERELRAGDWTGWRPTHMIGTKITGKTLGVIGMGRIGKAVARRCHHGFGMNVLFYDEYPVDDAEAASMGARKAGSMDQVLTEADIVSLHCPGGAKTHHLINEKSLASMKPSAILINTSRGDVIDNEALAQALNNGAIKAAGLDVFEGEPNINPALLAAKNLVMLPHLGSASAETRDAMGFRVIENLEAFFNGDTPGDVVS